MENIFVGNLDLLIKLAVAMVLGMIIGMERIAHGQVAGMRTYAMVSMGSAVFVLISQLALSKFVGGNSVDPLRMAAQIVVGVGFLGAGMIVFKKDHIIGLTTASGLWVSAGIGIASGYGLYSLAVIATILTFFIFTILFAVEEKFKKLSGVSDTLDTLPENDKMISD